MGQRVDEEQSLENSRKTRVQTLFLGGGGGKDPDNKCFKFVSQMIMSQLLISPFAAQKQS